MTKLNKCNDTFNVPPIYKIVTLKLTKGTRNVYWVISSTLLLVLSKQCNEKFFPTFPNSLVKFCVSLVSISTYVIKVNVTIYQASSRKSTSYSLNCIKIEKGIWRAPCPRHFFKILEWGSSWVRGILSEKINDNQKNPWLSLIFGFKRGRESRTESSMTWG